MAGFSLHSDGEGHKCLTLGYDGEKQALGDDFTVTSGSYAPLAMNGREVYKFATREVRVKDVRRGCQDGADDRCRERPKFASRVSWASCLVQRWKSDGLTKCDFLSFHM